MVDVGSAGTGFHIVELFYFVGTRPRPASSFMRWRWSDNVASLDAKGKIFFQPRGVATSRESRSQGQSLAPDRRLTRTPFLDLAFSLHLLANAVRRLMQELHFAEWEFSIYFVGYCDPSEIPSDPKERTRWCFQQVRFYLSGYQYKDYPVNAADLHDLREIPQRGTSG